MKTNTEEKNKNAQGMAQLRWKNTLKKDRKAHSKMMLEARWGKKTLQDKGKIE